ncbi:hypothetical protein NLX82_09680 [Paenibacillus sp. A3M_27_13]|nr:hypothetical protein [Paenibacillus sp. A3M_27_13]
MSFFTNDIKTIKDLKVIILGSSILSLLLCLILYAFLYFVAKKKGRVYYFIDNISGANVELYLLKTTNEGYILLSDKPDVYSRDGFKILKKQEDILNKKIYSKPINL